MIRTTKQALAEALKQLLEKKTLDKITVSDLTDLCGVNRQTFYYHFKDIYDLLEWIYKEEFTRDVLQDNYDPHQWQIPYLAMFRQLQKNRVLVINLFHSSHRDLIERYVHQEAFRFIMGVLDIWEKDLDMPAAEEDKKFIAAFYQASFVDMVFEWIGRGMKDDPQQIVTRTAKLMEGSFADALRKFRL